jgi:hypothetical protein
MLSRQIDAQELYVRIGHHIDEMPARMELYSVEKDQTILTDFAPMVNEGVKLELLSDSSSVKPALAPGVQRWGAQYGASRPIEARTTAPRALHDRLIILDDSRVWSVSQSFKDLAARSPASIALVPADVATLKVPAYADIWKIATPL